MAKVPELIKVTKVTKVPKWPRETEKTKVTKVTEVLINRPGVAGAVLQSPPLLIN